MQEDKFGTNEECCKAMPMVLESTWIDGGSLKQLILLAIPIWRTLLFINHIIIYIPLGWVTPQTLIPRQIAMDLMSSIMTSHMSLVLDTSLVTLSMLHKPIT